MKITNEIANSFIQTIGAIVIFIARFAKIINNETFFLALIFIEILDINFKINKIKNNIKGGKL